MKRHKIIVSKDFLRVKLLLLALYLILETYYNYFISVRFDYMGFIPNLSLSKYILTKLIFIALLVNSYFIYKRSVFLYSIYCLLIFLFYLPIAILFSFSNFEASPFFSTVFFVLLFSTSAYINIPIPNWTISDKLKAPFLFLTVLFFFVPILLKFGASINLETLKLSQIYETREIFSKNSTKSLDYLYHILAKTIAPVGLLFFLHRKKYFYALVLILILLYLYIISGNKIVYFTVFIVLFFYFIGTNHASKISNFLLIMLLLFISFPIIEGFAFSEPLLSGIFVNRFLFIPALLTNFYFDYFKDNPFFFAESHFFNLFVKNPYNMPVGFLITKEYWGEPTAYANNGIISDGFMNLGYLGVFLFSIIFMIIFAFFNSTKINKVYFGIFFYYLFLILSTPFLSAFITGGMGIFIIFTVILLRDSKIQNTISSI